MPIKPGQRPVDFGTGTDDPKFIQWISGRYIDLAQQFAEDSKSEDGEQPSYGPGNSYHDFEGFASPEHTLMILQSPEVQERLQVMNSMKRELHPKLFETMLTHYVYSNNDSDYLVTVEEACTFLDIMDWMFWSRFWMIPDADESNPIPPLSETDNGDGTATPHE